MQTTCSSALQLSLSSVGGEPSRTRGRKVSRDSAATFRTATVADEPRIQRPGPSSIHPCACCTFSGPKFERPCGTRRLEWNVRPVAKMRKAGRMALSPRLTSSPQRSKRAGSGRSTSLAPPGFRAEAERDGDLVLDTAAPRCVPRAYRPASALADLVQDEQLHVTKRPSESCDLVGDFTSYISRPAQTARLSPDESIASAGPD